MGTGSVTAHRREAESAVVQARKTRRPQLVGALVEVQVRAQAEDRAKASCGGSQWGHAVGTRLLQSLRTGAGRVGVFCRASLKWQ